MTSPLLQRYTTPAERLRGAVWAEKFESNELVQLNEGILTDAPVVDNGATFDGVDNRIIYSPELQTFDAKELSIVIEFTPTFSLTDGDIRYFYTGDATEYFLQKQADNTLFLQIGSVAIATIPYATYSPAWVADGRNVLVISSQTRDTDVYLNGTQILTSDASAYTPSTVASLVIGNLAAGGAGFTGTIHNFSIFQAKLTEQEALDYYNQSIYSYRNNSTIHLPMRANNHDPSNSPPRTLDISGNTYHAEFGSGVAAAYPTKLDKRGYDFDGGDHMSISDISYRSYSTITVRAVVQKPDCSVASMIVSSGNASNVGFALGTSTLGRVGFSTGGLLPANGGASTHGEEPGWLHLVGVYDGVNTNLYVNGEFQDSAVTPLTPVGTSLDIFIGEYYDGSLQYTGEVLSTKIWFDKALTPLQIFDDYAICQKELRDV